MDICLSVAATALVLARMPAPVTLSWRHSVEHTVVEEVYRVEAGLLVVSEVRVQGPAAGIEPPGDAQFSPAGWRYSTRLPGQERVLLANAGSEVVLALAACRD